MCRLVYFWMALPAVVRNYTRHQHRLGHTGYRQNLQPERTLVQKKYATNAYAIIWYEIRQ